MRASREVRAAIGEVVSQVTWMEYQAARLVVLAGLGEDAMALLRPGEPLFKLARRAVARFVSAEQETLSWLSGAEELREERNVVVHSLSLHQYRGTWMGYHPKTGKVIYRQSADLVALAERARRHADDGDYMILYTWPSALGLADNLRTGDLP